MMMMMMNRKDLYNMEKITAIASKDKSGDRVLFYFILID